MATTEASVDAFQASELSHEENHGRRSPGETSLAAIGVKNTTGGAKYGAADGEFIRVMYPDSIEVSSRFRTGKGAAPTDFAFGKYPAAGNVLSYTNLKWRTAIYPSIVGNNGISDLLVAVQ